MYSIATYDFYLTRSIAAMAALSALCVFLYGIFLLMAVVHAAAQTSAQHHITTISAELSDIEAQYLADEQSLTPEEATSLGYITPSKVSVVYAHTPTALTFNAN